MERLVEKQMERPTLEEVKEYFKDAKSIRLSDGEVCDVDTCTLGVKYDGERWRENLNSKYWELTLWMREYGFMDIVEYKPKLTKDVPSVLTKGVLRGITEPKHYDNTNGSLYKFCEDKELNSYEFDIIKRVMRCRKKGVFLEDLKKTKVLIDLYIKEYDKQ